MTLSNQILNAQGQKYRDFFITKYVPLDELQSTLIELVHMPTGARILHIAANDPENLFCLSFQTLPTSSNGVAHILEHTVLCGSAKYPVKDPFFAMGKRSLNTFMNALTGPDFTCYPASSQVEKDFYNLLEVYLDAVFHPQLKKLSFLQEGHRLEFSERKNLQSSLQFQGVVYNEMKGSRSSSDTRLWKAVCKHLLPDLPYAFDTGGDPEEIPHLTYEELIEFHRAFYHPSRALFFFYGNLPLSKHLDFISEKVLQGAEKIAPLPPLPQQSRFSSPITAVAKYPITSSESLEKKTIFAFAWLTTSVIDQGELLALTLLDVILMDTDASPLRLALLKSGLCTQAGSSLDVEISEAPWVIICKGCETSQADALKQVLFNTLQALVKQPFSQDQIEAALHQLEFERTEIDNDDGPFGLTLFMRSALIAQHGASPEHGLTIHTLFNDLRTKLGDETYLSNLIYKYLLNNPHFLQLTLEADPHLEQEEAEREKRALDAIRRRMSPDEAQKIIAQSEELAVYQEATEHQSLDCLPKVSLHDVSPHARDFSLHECSEGRMQIFSHSCFTNQILYADLVFDLPDIPVDDLPLVSLFTRFLTEVGCGQRNYIEALNYAQGHTGGLSASLSLNVSQEDPDRCHPTLAIKGKALYRNGSKLFSLFSDYLSSPDFQDKNRIKELLSQYATSLQSKLPKHAMNYAIQKSLSPFSNASFVFDQWHGLPFYQAVMKWMKNPDALIEDLQRMQTLLLCAGTPHLVLSCGEDFLTTLRQEKFFNLGEKLLHKPLVPWQGNYSIPKIASQVCFIASPVAFTAWGTKVSSYKDPESPLLLLSTELLKNTVLHKEIREMGGAYGADASYSPATGNFHLYSYRDPHLAKTVASFQKALDSIAAAKFNEQELEEAKLGVLQTLDNPIAPGNRGMIAYSWKRIGRTHAIREAFRHKIFTASRHEIAEAVQRVLMPQNKILVSFLGKDLFEKEKKKLKQPIAILPLEIS